MNKIISLGLFIGLIAVSCTDPNTIGLEIQPTSDNIIISDTSSFSWQTSQVESEDSVRTDKALNLILGEIIDPDFNFNVAANTSSFLTQVLLTENNTDLGTNPSVDSVVLSYTYSGYYGDLLDFDSLIITELDQSLDINTEYYSNFPTPSSLDNLVLPSSVTLNKDPLTPILKVNLDPTFAHDLFSLGNGPFVDNETFLTHFNGLFISAVAENTMLYLKPDGSNSYLKIYYHNAESDTLSLDFKLGGEAVRFSLFNEKHNESIITDDSHIYIQSMAGYKTKISINNIDSLKALLEGKAINKVTMRFDVQGSQSEYAAHDQLVLFRVDQEGNSMVFLPDLQIEGATHFGGRLEDNRYEFNITRYFYQLLNNDSYTNDLYLHSYEPMENANRTILDKDIKLTIYYSEL